MAAVAGEKLSISLEAELVAEVRAGAADEGVSVSAWLAEAAAVKARQRRLGLALAEFAAEHGELCDGDIERLVKEARTRSVLTGGQTASAS